MGHSAGNMHSLPEHIREQTAVDYARTAPGVYNVPSTMGDLTKHLPSITFPTLVVWGDRDGTLAPTSFQKLVDLMPRAEGVSVRAGHVPHQSNAGEFNTLALEFLNRVG